MFILVAGAVLFFQLIVPPVAALADNGDFGKVISRFGLYADVHKTYQYADTKYQFHPEKRWVSDFVSVEIPLAQASIWLNSLLTKDGSFDIRVIGLIHGAIFLAALWLFAPLLADARPSVRWAMYGVVVFVYCDMMYATSLSSFYMDEPALLFMLLTAVFYLRVIRWHRMRDAVLLMICPFVMVAAKTQHALVGISIALLFIVIAKALRPVRAAVWYAAGLLLMLEAGVMIWKAQPPDYTYYPLYNITFETILPHSEDVTRTLGELGLDDSYRFCIGKKAYFPDSGMDDPAFRQKFFKQYSLGRLAAFYVKRPGVAYRTMVGALSEAGEQHAFGNFDISTGYPPLTESRRFTWWSDIKRYFFMENGRVFFYSVVVVCGLLCGLMGVQRSRLPAGAVAGGICLVAAACTEMILATLCDSMDIVRHSMMFFALFDMIVIATVYLAATGFVGTKKGL